MSTADTSYSFLTFVIVRVWVTESYPAINSAVALTAALHVRYESRERVFTAGN